MLLEGAPWEFVGNHAALFELCAHTGKDDPLSVLMEMESRGWPIQDVWDLAWALSYRTREQYQGMTFLKFLECIPGGPDYLDFRSKVLEVLYKSLPQKREDEVPVHPQQPQPSGAGEIACTSAP